MRTPKRRRPRKEDRIGNLAAAALDELAATASYIISAEHKDYLTEAGPGKLRSDATACPRGLDFGEVDRWLRDSIVAGNASADVENDFPRYVWTRVDDQVYEARLSNSGLGQYKGYPITPEEAPSWLG